MYKSLGFMKDMNRADLLKMREGGMSNKAIAISLGCSYQTVYELIGRQPPEITKANRGMAAARATKERWKNSEGGYTVERKMQNFMPQREEPEPVKAVLAVKRSPIRLSGEYMHYTICPGREMIDVETEEGRVLIQIPADKLDTFIAELGAIKNNIGADRPMQFWG